MTFAEACAYARVGQQSMYRALRTRELKATQGAVRPDTERGRWRIHRDDLDEWIRGERPPEPKPLRRVFPKNACSRE
nr:helix-turn-helix domain-containing protein [Rhodococcus sp. UNC23MFCrub1.1]